MARSRDIRFTMLPPTSHRQRNAFKRRLPRPGLHVPGWADPFPLLYEAGDKGRLGAIHMRTQQNKIADQSMEDGGDIDFHKVAAYLKKIQFNGAVVEETEWMKKTKVTRSARENKKVARIWCEKVFGVSASR